MSEYRALADVARARYKLACDEMDRLTAGSPATNWRWSIPANPARDSDLILSASAEDVPRLADAVEALEAELEAEKVAEMFMTVLYTAAIRQLEGERDRARALAVRLEQDLALAEVGIGRRAL